MKLNTIIKNCIQNLKPVKEAVMRRLIVLSIAVLLTLSVFAGGKKEAAAEKPKEITFWMMLYSDVETQEKLIGDFAKEFLAESGVKVNYEFVNWAQAREKITTMHVGGEAPDVADLFWAYTFSDIGQGKHGTMPIEDYINTYIPDLEKRWVQSSLQDVKYKGHLYGIPWRVDVRPLVYRKDFVDKAGLDPKSLVSWDDLVTWGKRLTKKDASGKVSTYGIGIGGDLAQYFYNWIWQAGGSFLSEDYSKPTLDTPAGREALQFLVDLVQKHKVAPVDPALDPSYNWIAEFIAEKLVVLPVTSTIKPFVENNAPQLKDIIIAREPLENKQKVSFQGAGYFSVIYNTVDVSASMKWLAYLAKTDSMRQLAVKLGQLSPCKPALEDPYFTEDWWFRGHVKALPFGRTTQHPNAAWGAITNAKPGSPLYDMMVNALSGKVGVEEAIKTAHQSMEKLIASYK
jgi:ABC-type glycerol-3-phosphate transport system substrate-binding protein